MSLRTRHRSPVVAFVREVRSSNPIGVSRDGTSLLVGNSRTRYLSQAGGRRGSPFTEVPSVADIVDQTPNELGLELRVLVEAFRQLLVDRYRDGTRCRKNGERVLGG